MRGVFRSWLVVGWLLAASASCAVAGGWLTLAGDSGESTKRGLLAAGERGVSVDIDALFSHGHGETRNIAVSDVRELSLTGLRVLEGSGGARTWVGMHRDGDAEHNVFVTENNGYVYGTLYASDTVYVLNGDTRSGTVRLLDQKAAGYTLAPPTARDFVEPPPPTMAAQSKRSDATDATFATPAPQSVIDLLVVYTDGMVTRFGSDAGVLARINNLVAQANTAYLNSEVAITLRLVSTLRTSYSEIGRAHV